LHLPLHSLNLSRSANTPLMIRDPSSENGAQLVHLTAKLFLRPLDFHQPQLDRDLERPPSHSVR